MNHSLLQTIIVQMYTDQTCFLLYSTVSHQGSNHSLVVETFWFQLLAMVRNEAVKIIGKEEGEKKLGAQGLCVER